jgi:hypothetical protein
MTTSNKREVVWSWKVEATFNPRYDATATPEGLTYYCEIQGPLCGYDKAGEQTWDEFLSTGAPEKIEMPAWVEAAIRAYANALRVRTK